ncbi:MAG: ChbG/HpnK family deacetylase [Treponema sp.]|nr:ChbG/HpnK family deacetylase [Treponema sp.]
MEAGGEKRFILNADDCGLSEARNRAILEGYRGGLLKSASLCVNGEAFEAALRDILPACPGLGWGIHLNIVEGRALVQQGEGGRRSRLINREGDFNRGFLSILLNSGSGAFLRDVEREFRAQIEKGAAGLKRGGRVIDHLDSHVHVHGIPALFTLTLRLAREYGIPCVRTQYEKPYAVPRRLKPLRPARMVNLLKVAILNTLSGGNKRAARAAGLTTNDYLIGVGYTGFMDEAAVEYGLRALAGPVPGGKGLLVEALIHPGAEGRPSEYGLTQSAALAEKVRALGFRVGRYGEAGDGSA